MLCPACGLEVPDDALRCPHCGSELGVTRVLRMPRTRWCALCGALVPEGAKVCPSCGAPLPAAVPPAAPDPPVGESAEGTAAGAAGPAAPAHAARTAVAGSEPAEVAPRLGSARPEAGAARDAASPGDSLDPRMLALALVLALVVVGGAVLLIAHPWDPGSRNQARGTLDVSRSDPERVTAIAGQDASGSGVPSRLGRLQGRTVLEWEQDAYDMAASLAGRLEANRDLLLRAAAGDAGTGLDEGADEADAVLVELDTLADDLSSQEVPERYADDVANLCRLVGWLEECGRGLSSCWDAARTSGEGEREAAVEDALSDSGADEAWRLYEENRDAWAPQDRG